MTYRFINKMLGQYMNIIGYYFVKDYCINQSPEMSSYYNCLSVYYLVCSVALAVWQTLRSNVDVVGLTD